MRYWYFPQTLGFHSMIIFLSLPSRIVCLAPRSTFGSAPWTSILAKSDSKVGRIESRRLHSTDSAESPSLQINELLPESSGDVLRTPGPSKSANATLDTVTCSE